MQKMMTYSEANSVLGSSLTPLNRCLSKSVAIANDADPEPLENYENNRLVPASVIEPGTHVEVLHFFCDENGNDLGTDYTINVPEGQGAFVVYTRILIDGQVPDISCFDLDDWMLRTGLKAVHTYYYRAEPDTGANNFSYCDDSIDNNGIIRHVFYANEISGKIRPSSYPISINWSSEAESYGIDTKNIYTIQLNVNPVSHPDYSISKTILYFGYHNSATDQHQRDVGYTETITTLGFTNPTVTLLPKVSRIISEGALGEIDTGEQFSFATVNGNDVTFEKTKLPGNTSHEAGVRPSSSYYDDIYLILDSNKSLYIRISNGVYRDSYYNA